MTELSPVAADLSAIFESVRSVSDGDVATYIPALARTDPDLYAASLVTVDGGVYDLGDWGHRFTIQSVSKPFVFGLALDQHGLAAVVDRIGVEPSGDPFNAIELDHETHRPYNPMVNSGAIVTTSLIKPDAEESRMPAILRGMGRFAGRALDVDEEVYASERATGDRNFAIGYLLRNFDMLRGDVESVLDAYFRQCSLLVDVHDLAVMGATLANRGVNPLTQERALRSEHVPRVLSVMATCGMYDYAGEWVFRVGMPAKSGVSGAILAVLPGAFALAVFSPRLDRHGNSARGIRFIEEFSTRHDLHLMSSTTSPRRVVRRVLTGDAVFSRRGRTHDEYDVLRKHGHTTRVVEVQGTLGFSAAEALARAIAEQPEDTERLVIDMSRVDHVEATLGRLLRTMAASVAASDCDLVLAGHPNALWGQVDAVEFHTTDAALEWCETQLLAQHGLQPISSVELRDVDLLSGLPDVVLDSIRTDGRAVRLEPGDILFDADDDADSLFFLLEGRVDILLPDEADEAGDAGEERVSTLGPGAGFGEIGALFGGKRSATCRAATAATCWEIPWTTLRVTCHQSPRSIDRLYANVARGLAQRLRLADDERRALS